MSAPYREPVPVYPEPDRPMMTMEEAQQQRKEANTRLDDASALWKKYINSDSSLATFALLSMMLAQGEVNFWAITVRQLRLEKKVDELLERTDPNPQMRG